MKLVADRIEVLAAVKWYFESKNLSLRSALAFRAPLSVQQQADIRTHYSQYFVSLGSVSELLLEKECSELFKASLHRHFGNAATVADGESIYLYVKELRNAIVHRGADISEAAHFSTDFPLFLLPGKLADRWKKREYTAPTQYVVQLIELCERAVGPAVEAHLSDTGLLSDDVDVADLRANYLSNVEASTAMPKHVSTLAVSAVDTIDHRQVYRNFLERVRDVLRPHPVSVSKQSCE